MDAKSQLIGKDPDAEKDWGQEDKGGIGKRWFDSITNSMDMSLSKLQEILKDRGAWRAGGCGVSKSQNLADEQQQWDILFITK